MHCKKVLLFIFLIPTLITAQVRIGDFNYSKYKFKKLNKKSLGRFSQTKTTFVFPEYFPRESYEKLLSQVWDVTPYHIVFRDDFNIDSVKTNDGLARFESMEIEKTTKSGMTISYVFNYLDFHVVDKIKTKKKKKVWEKSRVGAIYFTPNIKIRNQIEASSGDRKIYGDLLNFRLGYLKNYLQLVNHNLKNNTSVDIYDNFVAPDLKKLKNQTLYIDSTFLYGYNPFTASEKISPEIQKLTKDYTYNVQVIDYKQLEEKIFNEKNDFFYLMYNQINSNKIINIVNGKTGEVVYQEHTTVSYNIKPKDFKKIQKAVDKLNK